MFIHVVALPKYLSICVKIWPKMERKDASSLQGTTHVIIIRGKMGHFVQPYLITCITLGLLGIFHRHSRTQLSGPYIYNMPCLVLNPENGGCQRAKRLVNKPLPSDKCAYFSVKCIHEAHTCETRSVHWLSYKHCDVWLTAVIVSCLLPSKISLITCSD